jgi:hypothetical protein
MNPWLIICSLDLSRAYDFKFPIFVCLNFWKGLNYTSKDALFGFHFFQNVFDFFKTVTKKKKVLKQK